MKDLLLIIAVIAALGHTTYVEMKTKPDLKARIAELTEENNAAREELAAEKERVIAAPPVVADVRPPDPEPIPEVPAFEEPEQDDAHDAAALAAAERERKATAIGQVNARLEQARANYREQVAAVEAQMQRGAEARNKVSSEQPSFQERTGGKGGIRTSDAQRQVWFKNRDARLAQIDAALASLRERRVALDTEWARVEAMAHAEINSLR